MFSHSICNVLFLKINRWSPSLRGADVGQYSDFIDGLGPGQLVGRQVLGASSLGDIQLSMCHQKGCLEVEVIRARGLQVCISFTLATHQHTNFFFYFFLLIRTRKSSVTAGLKSTSSALCQGIFSVWQKVHIESENDDRT